MSEPVIAPVDLSEEDQERLDRAAGEFDSEVTYLNTAAVGLPPRRSWDALQSALRDWRAGRADPLAYDTSVATARSLYGGLVGVQASSVAIGSQVSVLVGLIAASLPARSEVLTAAGDFTSVLFPFHAQAVRGVTVREAPLDGLADAVRPETDLVAVSAVQSADGRLADLDALEQACSAARARMLVDTTQAVGWLPVDAGRFAYTVAGGYKWLLAPRGTAYLTVGADVLDEVIPQGAGWYAGADRWESIYGSPLRLAGDARRLDVSPAWHAWVGAAPALELLAEVGVAALHRHGVGLANRFRSGVGLPPSNSAIVSAMADPGAAAAMADAEVVASVRAGRLRLSFHVSTTTADVERAINALAGHLRP